MKRAIVAALMLRYTRLGRHIYAIGSNENTARLCGVPVERTKVIVYMLAGFFGGLAGILQFSFISGIGQPTTAIAYELFVIAAVVIGGGSLLGGGGVQTGPIQRRLLARLQIGRYVYPIQPTGCVLGAYGSTSLLLLNLPPDEYIHARQF